MPPPKAAWREGGARLHPKRVGATLGTKYDQLKVTQGATLSGTLNIALGSFTPTVGQKFTILTAPAVSGTFTTVNGLAINGTEHFTIIYNAGSVVLTVVSGALPASNFGSSMLVTRLLHPPVSQGSAVKVHAGVAASGHSLARVPSVPLSGVMRTTPVAAPAFGSLGMGLRGFRPMDSLASTALAASSAGTDAVGLTGAFGIAPVSAASYNSMSGMNHMRFECGVDLKGLLKTSRKRLIKPMRAHPPCRTSHVNLPPSESRLTSPSMKVVKSDSNSRQITIKRIAINTIRIHDARRG